MPLYARHVLSDGTPDGEVHTLTTHADVLDFDAAGLSSRDLLVAWSEGGATRVARFHDQDGGATMHALHSEALNVNGFPRVAVREDGDLLVAWRTSTGRLCAKRLNGDRGEYDIADTTIGGSTRLASRGLDSVAAWRTPETGNVFARTIGSDEPPTVIAENVGQRFLSLSCNSADCAVYVIQRVRVIRRDF